MNHKPFEKLLQDRVEKILDIAEKTEDDPIRRTVDIRMVYLLKDVQAGRITIGKWVNEVIKLETLLPDGEGWRFSDYIS